MSGFSPGSGVIPPAGDIGGTVLLPRISDIGGVPLTLLGGAIGDVLTQQGDGSYAPDPGGGGGGAAKIGAIGLFTGPDSGADNTTTNGGGLLSSGQVFSFGSAPNHLDPLWPDISLNPIGFGWVVATDAGASVVMMPRIVAPAFTGTPHLTVELQIMATSTDYASQARWDATFNLTTAQDYQTVIGDWVNEYNNGGVNLVAGINSGSGIVDPTGTKTFLGSCVGQVTVPPGTVFT